MIPSTCGETFAVCIGVTMPFASMSYGTDVRLTGTTVTATAGRGGRAGALLHAPPTTTDTNDATAKNPRLVRDERFICWKGNFENEMTKHRECRIGAASRTITTHSPRKSLANCWRIPGLRLRVQGQLLHPPVQQLCNVQAVLRRA